MTPEIRDAIIKYRCEKAVRLLGEIDVLIDNHLFNSAINRMYYACFHAVSALLVKSNIEVKSHKGLRQLLGMHLVKTGIVRPEEARIFSRIYDKRQASDYDDFMEFDAEEVNILLPQVKVFVNRIISMTKD